MCLHEKRKNVNILIYMTKYTNGKIYKIVNEIDSKIYIDSTIMSLVRRKVNIK